MPTIAENILQLLHIEIHGGADVHELDALISTRFPVLQQRLSDCGLVTEETATVYSQQDIRDIVAYIRDDLRQTGAGVETSLQKLESVLEDCFSENLESQTQSIPWQRFHFCFQVADMLAEKTQIPVETYRIGILQELANNIEEGGHCFAGTMNRLYMGYLAPNIMLLVNHPELVEIMSSELPVAVDLTESDKAGVSFSEPCSFIPIKQYKLVESVLKNFMHDPEEDLVVSTYKRLTIFFKGEGLESLSLDQKLLIDTVADYLISRNEGGVAVVDVSSEHKPSDGHCSEAAAACSIFAPHHLASDLPATLGCRVKETIMPFIEGHDLDETVIAEITDAIISEVGCRVVNDQDLTDIAAGVMYRSYQSIGVSISKQ